VQTVSPDQKKPEAMRHLVAEAISNSINPNSHPFPNFLE